jgi:hypothetical protein
MSIGDVVVIVGGDSTYDGAKSLLRWRGGYGLQIPEYLRKCKSDIEVEVLGASIRQQCQYLIRLPRRNNKAGAEGWVVLEDVPVLGCQRWGRKALYQWLRTVRTAS